MLRHSEAQQVGSRKEWDRRWRRHDRLTYYYETSYTEVDALYEAWTWLGVKVKQLGCRQVWCCASGSLSERLMVSFVWRVSRFIWFIVRMEALRRGSCRVVAGCSRRRWRVDVQGENVVGERPFQLAYANQYIRRMSKREMRIRVHGTLMSIPVAVFMTSLKPHDQGIYPFPERALGHCVSCSGPLATYVAAYRA